MIIVVRSPFGDNYEDVFRLSAALSLIALLVLIFGFEEKNLETELKKYETLTDDSIDVSTQS